MFKSTHNDFRWQGIVKEQQNPIIVLFKSFKVDTSLSDDKP